MDDSRYVAILIASLLGLVVVHRLIHRDIVGKELQRIIVLTSPLQSRDGVMALMMALQVHGRSRADREVDAFAKEIEARINDDTGFSSAKRILEAAKAFGLDGRGVRLPQGAGNTLARLRRGDILHLNDPRFVVFEGVEGEDVCLVDSMVGRVRLSKELFWARFDGVALVFGARDYFGRRE